MRAWTRKHTLVAGLALILATNAVVLAGVAYNRSGEPESVLRLTERELVLPHSWGFEAENSGVSLNLAWRVHHGPSIDVYHFGHSYGGEADWLDRAKLMALGFDLSEKTLATNRQLPRDALLVLELDGPAWRAALERAEQRAKGKPDKWATQQLERERGKNSRLFVVDAGTDLAALRSRYPDRSQYAIVKGQVRLHYRQANDARPVAGYVADVSITTVHVPVELHGVVRREGSYQASVAFGRRLEPWLLGAAARTR